jgi:hypothetical protein
MLIPYSVTIDSFSKGQNLLIRPDTNVDLGEKFATLEFLQFFLTVKVKLRDILLGKKLGLRSTKVQYGTRTNKRRKNTFCTGF